MSIAAIQCPSVLGHGILPGIGKPLHKDGRRCGSFASKRSRNFAFTCSSILGQMPVNGYYGNSDEPPHLGNLGGLESESVAGAPAKGGLAKPTPRMKRHGTAIFCR